MLLALATLLLAAVLAVSGAAKLIDLGGSAAALRGFGVPERLAPAAALALPLAELAIAAALLVPATTRAGAAAALALFAGMAVVVGVTLARGRRPDCGCFGKLHSQPIGRSTLARTVGLAAIAAFVALGGTRHLGALSLLAAATVVHVSLTLHLLHQNGRLLERVRALEAHEPPAPVRLGVGSAAPAFALQDASGRFHTLDDLLVPGLPVVLAFSDPECADCADLPVRLARLQERLHGELAIALVTRGVPADEAFEPTLYQEEIEVARAYGVTAVPTALVIAPDGRIAGEPAVGEAAIDELLAPRALRAVS